MILSGSLLPVGDVAPPPSEPGRAGVPGRGLEIGRILTGRVTQLGDAGQGVLRFPDGRGFQFSHGPTLRPGDMVQVQVVRLVPELAFRMLSSSTGVATGLAHAAEQSLVRAPEIFAQLLAWSDTAPAGKMATGLALSDGALQGGMPGQAGIKAGGTWITRSHGLTLAQLLQESLPNLSSQGLLRGNVTALVRLLEGGSRQDLQQVIRQLRHVATDFVRLPSSSPGASEQTPALQTTASQAEQAVEQAALRNSLQRLGDLLAMQEILPRTPLALESDHLLAYRLFWLTEGGLGEAIWKRERERKRGQRDAESTTSVLLSLNMTDLGAVQARVAYREGFCSVALAAEEEAALTALRRDIGSLRAALLAAELPLRALDLVRLKPGEMREKRMRALELDSRFVSKA